MTLFFCIAFSALAVCVVAALYPELVTKPFAGSGKRRKQSPVELLADNQRLKRELAEAKRVKPCTNCGHLADGVMPTVAEIADSDRSDTTRTINAPAPVDNGSRDIPLTAAATVRDASLADIALPGEEEMAAFLEGEQAKNRAKAEADTQQIRLPKIPDRSPIPDPVSAEIEARLNIPGPHPFASATSIPREAVDNAVSSVEAVMSEAS